MKLLSKIFGKKSDKRTSKQKTGDKGEDLAVKYLEENGYLILERKWRYGKSEIDIIVMKNETVAFVEVKTTASDAAEDYKRPAAAVTFEKQKNMKAAAKAFVNHRIPFIKFGMAELNEEYRFDVIEVFLNRETPEINHIENAFIYEKGYRRWKT
ncbi:MAG: YraN family protein [Ruminococcaceae bacterium]|nr:YraN family protein [Oscillospiraceae bacterium]